jgi:hypothetical protein
MWAKELISVPVWKGNRILDTEHASKIKEAIGDNINRLDSGYTIIRYNEEASDGRIILSSYLIDGQHRASVIRDFYNSTICEPDFQLTITERTVESESEAIDYFNSINNVKPQFWKTDPNLLVNSYIKALEAHYNKNKKALLIRSDNTKRPYLAVSALRDTLRMNVEYLKSSADDINKFVERVDKYNTSLINSFNIDFTQANIKDEKLKERMVSMKFAIAYDLKLRWIRELIA